MKKLLLLLIIPLLSFGQDNCFVTDTVKLIAIDGDMYEPHEIHFQSLTNGERIFQKNEHGFSNGKVEKIINDNEYLISFDHSGWTHNKLVDKMALSLSNEDSEDDIYIIKYKIKKYKLSTFSDGWTYIWKTGNYLLDVEQLNKKPTN